MPKSKKLIRVSEDIFEEAMEAARSEARSVNSFIDEALKYALQAKKLGYNLKKATELLEVAHVRTVLGGTFVPSDILNHLVAEAHENGEQLQERWYESGSWHGRYLKEKFTNPLQTFKAFLEATRWDLDEVEVKQEGDNVKLRLVSTILTAEETELLLKYVEGAIRSMGYKTVKSDRMKGIITLEFKH